MNLPENFYTHARKLQTTWRNYRAACVVLRYLVGCRLLNGETPEEKSAKDCRK